MLAGDYEVNLTQLLDIAEVLRQLPAGSLQAVRHAVNMKDVEPVNRWDEVFHEDIARTVTEMDAVLKRLGLIFPGVDRDCNKLRKIPAIRDTLNPPAKKGKR